MDLLFYRNLEKTQDMLVRAGSFTSGEICPTNLTSLHIEAQVQTKEFSLQVKETFGDAQQQQQPQRQLPI